MILGKLPTLRDAVESATRQLAEAGLEEPRREARAMIYGLLGGGPELLLADPERQLSEAESCSISAALQRRLRREPLSRILGRREFWSLEFQVDPSTLDPRPDSETLVEAVLAWIGPRRGEALQILDLGCGSGCLLLALLSELPQARGLGIDLASGAVAASARNAGYLGLAGRTEFREGSWLDRPAVEAVPAAWDIIVSNPPYVPSGDIAGLAPEVADYDPPLALDGGRDGLDAYRRLIPQSAVVLDEGGLLALEVGAGQAVAVSSLLRTSGFLTIWTARDLSGIERCVLATRALKSRAIQPNSTPLR